MLSGRIWEECSSSAPALKPGPLSLALLLMWRDNSLSHQAPSPRFLTHSTVLCASKTLHSELVQREGYPSVSGQDLIEFLLMGAGRKGEDTEDRVFPV